jgi:hypothetical protein
MIRASHAAFPLLQTALVAHLMANPEFKCGLDVFEDEVHSLASLLPSSQLQ